MITAYLIDGKSSVELYIQGLCFIQAPPTYPYAFTAELFNGKYHKVYLESGVLEWTCKNILMDNRELCFIPPHAFESPHFQIKECIGIGKKETRPDKDTYFMSIVEAVSQRSTCLRHKIGAVIVDKQGCLLSTGYNGAPRGLEHCLDIGCIRDQLKIKSGEQQQTCRAVHAEQNAIIQASRHGADLRGTTLYSTFYPCIICTKMIINAGISRVVYKEKYPNELGDQLFADAGIELRQRKGE